MGQAQHIDLDAVANPDAVLFSELETVSGKKIGVACLNVERSLNALSLDMINLLYPQLIAWQDDPNIACVWLEGAGEKAFCAGGDIVAMYQAIKAMPNTAVPEVVGFFSKEYRLDYLIQTYRKPMVVWGDGFVMGGGMGLMNGASHRVVTERSRLAMPEISIGLYPDVGATYFLGQLPDKMGLFLGLTAAQVNGADALYLGMADYALPSAGRDSMKQALVNASWTDDQDLNLATLSDALSSRSLAQDELPVAELAARKDEIAGLMDADGISAVTEQFLAYETDDALLSRAQKTLQAGCPMTAHIVWQQLQFGTELTLADAFRLELTLSVNCAVKGDFAEGVRALLIDKDRNPKWSHSAVAEVSQEDLDDMFIAPWGEGEHPLNDLV
ncbi:enoyl-CoA hydratase/isomerase family protein [Aliidiomarina halalkaliphila]|uniref:3-hydroxyisobutyryl-CoA hydrolase n=1 Tax=Aliidiomarina halalkaliphila TaxID=2593535 RepID=A0A552X3J9_9GAMM|nr:enoyl-CoA hydratase/isomerase family protein [Aliidiomarina halalkaliphila]TRW49546.1 enoyl-CoA hydratase/isomerase family protein [Aliidiomarina halalkaliphila]